jgi:hypothetical protein
VLTNAEAYDNWPSKAELPFVRLTQLPLLGRLVIGPGPSAGCTHTRCGAARPYDPATLTPELLRGYLAPTATADRRATAGSWPGSSTGPTSRRPRPRRPACGVSTIPPHRLGENDPHFGPEWGERLQRDIPGAQLLILLPATGTCSWRSAPNCSPSSSPDSTSAPVASSST